MTPDLIQIGRNVGGTGVRPTSPTTYKKMTFNKNSVWRALVNTHKLTMKYA